jgi:dual specificity phosphatase 12
VRAGVSRSAAVATALLMAAESLSSEAALAAVQAAHPAAAPNDGFVAQLQLFGDMQCRLNESHAPYRRFRVARAASAHAAGTAQAGDAAALLSADPAAAGGAADGGAAGAIRCRKCRRLLAAAEHTVAHERGAGVGAFDAHKRRKGGDAHASSGALAPCSSIFVEPLAWMAAAMADGALEGKLCCPKCAGRLGSFSWAGEQCSCGAWVVPAFQLHAARVDVTQPRA